MLDILQYPFDGEEIMKHRKKIKSYLLEGTAKRQKKKIAVLGGSTTHDIIAVLELFLLDLGIEAQFYESEYAKFWEDACFPDENLKNFDPDFIFIHTTSRNLNLCPLDTSHTKQEALEAVEKQFNYFKTAWEALDSRYHCPIIQNNFEMPLTRLFGNQDGVTPYGKTFCVNKLNEMFAQYASCHENFYIHDINYLSACWGIDSWSDPKYWYLYKYAMCIDAIPDFAYSVFKILRSCFGKNKKVLCLDLDNTLWGGVIGDDGVDGIEIGKETNLGQGYTAFQEYIKAQKQIGVVLAVDSKNDPENALAGLNHPECILKPEDFVSIKANWEPKDRNLLEIADDLSLLPESFVFVDDNPAEREIVAQNVEGAAVPEFESVEDSLLVLDRSGYFEVTSFSDTDKNRTSMYKANAKRKETQKSFSDYGDYLKSLEMKAEICDFKDIYLPRITQLTNKSNQFNLTTKRFTIPQMEECFKSSDYIRLYGRLEDKFGDNGICSVVIGKINEKRLDIELWLMSCRVLKRGMEFAMLDELLAKAKACKIEEIFGYYYKTAKNAMVSKLYETFGFELVESKENGDSVWKLNVDGYKNKNKYIKIK